MVLLVVVVIECSRARGSMVVVINPARQVGIVITAENWYSRLSLDTCFRSKAEPLNVDVENTIIQLTDYSVLETIKVCYAGFQPFRVFVVYRNSVLFCRTSLVFKCLSDSSHCETFVPLVC